MADASEMHPEQSPEQAVRSFREDLLAGSGFEYLMDTATIHYVRVGEDDFADITATPDGIVTVKPEDQSGATIYTAYEEALLANDESFLHLRVCPPDEVADFVENLGKRSPGSERITLEVDITPPIPPELAEERMGLFAAMWREDEEALARTVADHAIEVGGLTERFYPVYIEALGEALGREGIDPDEGFGFPPSLDLPSDPRP